MSISQERYSIFLPLEGHTVRKQQLSEDLPRVLALFPSASCDKDPKLGLNLHIKLSSRDFVPPLKTSKAVALHFFRAEKHAQRQTHAYTQSHTNKQKYMHEHTH